MQSWFLGYMSGHFGHSLWLNHGCKIEFLHNYNCRHLSSTSLQGDWSGKFLGFMVSQWGIEANPNKIKAIMEIKSPKTVKEVQSLIGKVASLNKFISRVTNKCLPFFKVLKKAFQWIDKCEKALTKLKDYLTQPPLLSPLITGEKLHIYLVVSNMAVSLALIRENEDVQWLVYYNSQAF